MNSAGFRIIRPFSAYTRNTAGNPPRTLTNPSPRTLRNYWGCNTPQREISLDYLQTVLHQQYNYLRKQLLPNSFARPDVANASLRRRRACARSRHSNILHIFYLRVRRVLCPRYCFKEIPTSFRQRSNKLLYIRKTVEFTYKMRYCNRLNCTPVVRQYGILSNNWGAVHFSCLLRNNIYFLLPIIEIVLVCTVLHFSQSYCAVHHRQLDQSLHFAYSQSQQHPV